MTDLDHEAAERPLVDLADGWVKREIALLGRIARLEALVRSLGKCHECHGSGECWPICDRCNDSTDDHECPPKGLCWACAGTGLVEAARKELEND